MDEWLTELIGDSEENRRLVARENLKAQVSEAIWGLINKSTLRRKDLAAKGGFSAQRFSQLIAAEGNLTLEVVSDLAFALDAEACVGLVPAQAKAKAVTAEFKVSWTVQPSKPSLYLVYSAPKQTVQINDLLPLANDALLARTA